MRARLLLATLAAAGALLAAASAAPAAGPRPGVVASLPLSAGDRDAIAASGAKVVRVFMFERGYDDAGFRLAADQIAALGAQPLFVVVGDTGHPPRSATARAAFAAFVRARAAEFRGRVAGWEIWNEEDAAGWWAGAPQVDGARRDAGPYTRLLRSVHAAVRAVDRRTPVVLGGLTGNDDAFVRSVYAHGGRGAFDAVAVHTDTACNLLGPTSFFRGDDGRISQFSFLGFREVHRTMAAHGDGRKPVWMTELGWSTAGGRCDTGRYAGQKDGGVAESVQAAYLTLALHCLAQAPYVHQAIVFALRDGDADTPAARFGLLRHDGSRKPAFDAFSAYARSGDARGGAPCGDFAGPRIAVGAPRPGLRFGRDLRISASARDGAGVPRITLLADGRKIRNFTDAGAPGALSATIDWQGAKRLRPGRHRITVLALDAFRNVSRRTVVVVKLAR